jgi:hypothetical protein
MCGGVPIHLRESGTFNFDFTSTTSYARSCDLCNGLFGVLSLIPKMDIKWTDEAEVEISVSIIGSNCSGGYNYHISTRDILVGELVAQV